MSSPKGGVLHQLPGIRLLEQRLAAAPIAHERYHYMQVSRVKLCAGRAFWLVAYPSQDHEMLFDAHIRWFVAMGGIARPGIYDDMKTSVDKVNKGKGRTANRRFAARCAHYLSDADLCNVGADWEKGVVDKNVQDSRRHEPVGALEATCLVAVAARSRTLRTTVLGRSPISRATSSLRSPCRQASTMRERSAKH